MMQARVKELHNQMHTGTRETRERPNGRTPTVEMLGTATCSIAHTPFRGRPQFRIVEQHIHTGTPAFAGDNKQPNTLSHMAFRADLEMNGKTYRLLHCSYALNRDVDHTGRPSSEVKGGTISSRSRAPRTPPSGT